MVCNQRNLRLFLCLKLFKENDLSPEIRVRFNVAALTLSFLLIINILVLFKSQSNKKYADSKISLLNNLELYE
jgi:hypothetical protein